MKTNETLIETIECGGRSFQTRNKPYHEHILLSTKEIAAYMRVSRVTVFKWIKKCELPAHLMGKSYMVTLGDLEKYLMTEVDLEEITKNRC